LPLFCLKTFIFKNLAVKTKIWRNFTIGLAASSQFHLALLPGRVITDTSCYS